MPDAIGLVYCTLHQVYILPEDSADSEHPVYLWNFWRAGQSGLKRRFSYVVLVRMCRYYAMRHVVG